MKSFNKKEENHQHEYLFSVLTGQCLGIKFLSRTLNYGPCHGNLLPLLSYFMNSSRNNVTKRATNPQFLLQGGKNMRTDTSIYIYTYISLYTFELPCQTCSCLFLDGHTKNTWNTYRTHIEHTEQKIHRAHRTHRTH